MTDREAARKQLWNARPDRVVLQRQITLANCGTTLSASASTLPYLQSYALFQRILTTYCNLFHRILPSLEHRYWAVCCIRLADGLIAHKSSGRLHGLLTYPLAHRHALVTNAGTCVYEIETAAKLSTSIHSRSSPLLLQCRASKVWL